MAAPLFLTVKFRLQSLNSIYNVHDFQIRDHFINMSDLYWVRCDCKLHKHSKRKCRISDKARCPVCQSPNRKLADFRSMLFHEDLLTKKMHTCCWHVHEPPCRRCLGCRTGRACVVEAPFECNVTTNAVCSEHPEPIFSTPLPFSNVYPNEHVYNIRCPRFYFCLKHQHRHVQQSHLACIIQSVKCCDDAVRMEKFDSSFVVTTTADGKKPQDYIIYDPSIWREQSYNHFMSFIRGIIVMPSAVLDRYKRFESSNFDISNIKRYKSGRESLSRTAVTGFEAQGIYQTSTISCLIPYYEVMLPQKLVALLRERGFDLQLVCVKRDPSIKPTCNYVCRARENPEPNIDVIVIPDAISKGLNQDQDGDKNAVYFLRTLIDDEYDARDSFRYRLGKVELAAAFRKTQTLIGMPRYHFSETNQLMIYRHGETSFADKPFYQQIRGIVEPWFLNEAAAGYLRPEFDTFCHDLIEFNDRNEHHRYVTLDDLTLVDSDRLCSIFKSNTKGNSDMLKMLLKRILDNTPLGQQQSDMIAQLNKYIMSSQNLSRNGRKQFTALYAAQDLIVMLGSVFLNKVLLADYTTFPTAALFSFNLASLRLFTKDLKRLSESQSQDPDPESNDLAMFSNV